MKTHLLLWGVLAIFVKALLVTGDDDEATVLADNKCMCTRVTSRIIRSTEDPNEDIVERNIRIVVPLNNRENISDPNSPLRRNFVYHLSDICKKCDPVEVELEDQVVTATQSNICNEDSGVPETCYIIFPVSPIGRTNRKNFAHNILQIRLEMSQKPGGRVSMIIPAMSHSQKIRWTLHIIILLLQAQSEKPKLSSEN